MCVARAAISAAHVSPVTAPPAALIWTDAQLVLGARLAWGEGRLDDARAMLDEATRRFPGIADHIAVMLGEIELEAGDPAAARTRFETALESNNPSLRLEARIGRVRAMVELGTRDSATAIEQLLVEFPELPDAERLAFARASALERTGDLRAAAASYREIDLDYPGSAFADESRARIALLIGSGTNVVPFTIDERVARATRLTSTGPMQPAREAVERLRLESDLSAGQSRTLTRLAIRIARVEGRFADVDALERELRGPIHAAPTAPSTPTEPDDLLAAGDEPFDEEDVGDVVTEADTEAQAEADDTTATATLGADAIARRRRARLALARALHGHTVAQAPIDRLGEVADYAAGGALDDTLRVVMARARGENVPAEVRFAVAVAASGRLGFEEAALTMLGTLGEGAPELATGARYHRARLFERMGRLAEARNSFTAILAADRSSGRYYSLWSAQRLAAVEDAIRLRDASASNAPENASVGAECAVDAGVPVTELVDAGTVNASGLASRGGRTFDLDASTVELPSDVDVDALATELDGLARNVGTTYPWIGRAADLLRVRAVEEARAEMFEALVAHRLARGKSVHRYGLEAVSRGVSRAARPQPRSRTRTRAAAHVSRRPLDDAARNTLADVAAALGDHGTAIALGGTHSADERPHAFGLEVARAARQYGVDPNLLWAVMRVESVYQPRIVSYAGAIGLMQIMPRTGRLIAQRMGRSRFTTAQLLDPQTNLDFAAWYLRSLLDRFDGHAPLAIAAYNGGPHNVRVWLERSGPEMPLDAFLERIPFTQTHGYVRKVLTHYAAYRARDGLPMIDLAANVPAPRPDDVAF